MYTVKSRHFSTLNDVSTSKGTSMRHNQVIICGWERMEITNLIIFDSKNHRV